MSETSHFDRSRARADHPLLTLYPKWVGAAAAAFGFLIIFSWFAHWQKVLQLIPNTAPMQFNTAICFVLSGLALFVMSPRPSKFALGLGGTVGILTGLTLVEYLTGLNLYLDQLFHEPYFQMATTYAGRMSPLAAVCFVFIGTAIVLGCANEKWPHRLAVAGLLASVVMVISIVALFGFAFGIQSAYGWGAYSQIAVNTSLALFALSGGLLIWAWRSALLENYNFLRWLPVTASVTLMVMVAFVSAVNMNELKDATYWRQHTVQVILSTESFLNNLLDMQRGARGYYMQSDINALASFEKSSEIEKEQFSQLLKLTGDNASQQQKLRSLVTTIDEVLAYDRRVIAIHDNEGHAAVTKIDATGQGREIFGRARDILKAFSQTEEGLLDVRNKSEQADYNNASRLLIWGSGLAALLVIVGNFMASREMTLRKRVQSRLTETLTLQNAILKSASYAIISLDRSGIVKTFNPAAEQMLGYRASEVVGKATPMLWCDAGEVAARAKRLSEELNHPVKPDMEGLVAKAELGIVDENEVTFVNKNGRRFPVLLSLTALADDDGNVNGFLGVVGDISERKRREAEREGMITELQQALADVKVLSGLIPICGWCKNVRSDKGFWSSVEDFVRTRTAATFSHGVCPDCSKKLKADILKANAAPEKPVLA